MHLQGNDPQKLVDDESESRAGSELHFKLRSNNVLYESVVRASRIPLGQTKIPIAGTLHQHSLLIFK